MSNSLCKHCGGIVISRYIELLVDSGRIVYTINCYQQLRRVTLRLRQVWKEVIYYDSWKNDFWDNAFEPLFDKLIQANSREKILLKQEPFYRQ